MKTITLSEAFEKASKRIGRNIPPVSSYPIIYGDDAPNHVHVAQIITRGIPPEVAEANASLICHTFNHFQEVVDSLKKCEDVIGMATLQGTLSDNPFSPQMEALIAARKALDKVRNVTLP